MDSEPPFVASEGKTFKQRKGVLTQLGDFQLNIIGELSTDDLSKTDADQCKGGQWLCNFTCLMSGELTTRYGYFSKFEI